MGRKWAEAFLFRHDYVKRKLQKQLESSPPDFSDVKLGFLQRIKDKVASNSIPLALVFNFDQTGSKLVPVCEWTMEKQGSRQVPVVGKEDKREITVLLTVTATGKLLPPQVIYQGKTPGCHPKVTFPSSWNITHSESHWSTEKTMLEYVDQVLVPCVSQTRQELELADDHPALAIFDVFRAHRCESFLKKLCTHNKHQVFVPAGCTGELQPLDLSVNEEFKAAMKSSFSRWYADEVKQALDQGVSLDNLKVDLRANLIKPLHANWFMLAMSTLQHKPDAVCRGFEKSGIIEFLQ